MDEGTRVRKGPPFGLWFVGAVAVVGGLVVRSKLIESAREKAYVNQLYDGMIGHDPQFSPDYSDANVALAVVAIGVLLLAVALTVTLVRRS